MVQTIMKRPLLVTAALLCATAAHADGYVAVAPIANGLSLTVMDHGISCNGKATAFVTDAGGIKRDQTCNVHITKKGVSVRFASFPDPLYFKQEEFTVMPAP